MRRKKNNGERCIEDRRVKKTRDSIFIAFSSLNHDFSGTKDFETRITHILYHLMESKHDMKSILSYESAEIFWNYFKKYLEILFADFVDIERYQKLPRDFLLNHMAGSFVEMVKWWMVKDMKPEPEKMTEYYITVM